MTINRIQRIQTAFAKAFKNFLLLSITNQCKGAVILSLLGRLRDLSIANPLFLDAFFEQISLMDALVEKDQQMRRLPVCDQCAAKRVCSKLAENIVDHLLDGQCLASDESTILHRHYAAKPCSWATAI